MSEVKTFPCPQCGEPVIEGQLYCRSCNAWLGEEPSNNVQKIPEEAPGWKKALGVQVGILVFIGIVLLAVTEEKLGVLSPWSNIFFVTAIFSGFLLCKTGETPHLSGGVSNSTSYKAAGVILLFGFAVFMLAKSPSGVSDLDDVIETLEDALYTFNLRSLAIAFTIPLAVIALVAGRNLGKGMRLLASISILVFYLGVISLFGNAIDKKDSEAFALALPALYLMLFFIPLMFITWAVSGSPLGNWGSKNKIMAIIAPTVILIVGFYFANHPWLFLSEELRGHDEDFANMIAKFLNNIAVYILPIMALIAAAVHLKTIGAQETLLFNKLKWSHVTAIAIVVWGVIAYLTQGRVAQSMALYFTLPLAIIAQQIMAKKEEVIY